MPHPTWADVARPDGFDGRFRWNSSWNQRQNLLERCCAAALPRRWAEGELDDGAGLVRRLPATFWMLRRFLSSMVAQVG
jgi:hypothetical protein